MSFFASFLSGFETPCEPLVNDTLTALGMAFLGVISYNLERTPEVNPPEFRTEPGYFHSSARERRGRRGVLALQGRVLLLNGSSWEPLAVISTARAISLLLSGKAVVIEESGSVLRTVNSTFPVPSVIALRRFINVPRRRAHWSRKGVLVRDSYTCIYCSVKVGDVVRGKTLAKADFTVDHILPRSRGGRDNWSNTACACYHCNHRKGNHLPGEVGMKLLWEPKTPRTSYLVIAVGSGPEAWRHYIEIQRNDPPTHHED